MEVFDAWNLEPKWQNIYRFQASTLIKRITETHKINPLYKHQKNVIDKIKKELNTEVIRVMKADKNKAMVLIDRKQGMDKVHKFLKDNSISTIKQDPTTKYHKQIQKTIKSYTQLVDKKHRDI